MLALSTSLWLVGRMLKYNIMLTIFVAVALFSTGTSIAIICVCE